MEKIKNYILCSTLMLSAGSVQAMEVLSEHDLSQSTGQDGVTLGLNLGTNGRITFDHMVIEDRDGFKDTNLAVAGNQSTHPNAAGLAYITQGANRGVQFLAGTTPLASPFSVVVDADGNNSNPVMNIGIQFSPNLSQIKLDAFSLGLVKLNPANQKNPTIDVNSRRDILKTGASGLDIMLKTGNTLGINLQLGSQPQDQNAMFVFSGGSIERIKTDQPIEILSYANCVATAPCVSNSSLKFGFDLTATNTTGIRLAGTYMKASNNGLEVGKVGTLDPFGVKLTDVTMGNAGASNANVFNGLPNAAIGTIGLEKVQVTGLKMNIKGL